MSNRQINIRHNMKYIYYNLIRKTNLNEEKLTEFIIIQEHDHSSR